MGENLENVNEIASRLGVSPRTVWKLVGEGKLPAPLSVGRQKRWRWGTVQQWIEAAESEALHEQSRRLRIVK